MGIEISELKKNVGDYIEIYPYTEDKIKDELWEVYPDKDGNEVELSKEWRKISFRCHYPTNDRLKKLASYIRGTTQVGGVGLIQLAVSDIKEGVRYIVNNIITDVHDITSEGQRLVYTKKQSSKGESCAKDIIEDQFLKSPLLLDGFISEYNEQAGKLKGKPEDSSKDSEDNSESNLDLMSTKEKDSDE